MLRHWISVLNATGVIENEIATNYDPTPTARPGATWVDIAALQIPFGTVTAKVWNGSAVVAAPVVARRVISAIEFQDRLTQAEDEALELLALTAANTTVRSRLSAWRRRVVIRGSVDLDSAELIAVLAFLKANAIPALWPDNATADTRIAAIRA